jgi:uncharacterized protein
LVLGDRHGSLRSRIGTEQLSREESLAGRQHIPAGHGAGLLLGRGEQLRIIDPEGGQSGDLVAFSQDGSQRLSNGRSFDYGGKLYLSTGDVIWSDRSQPMLTIVADDVGRHDFLYAPCSQEMYRMQYGVTGYHANCADNLCSALRELGMQPEPLPTAFNFFMNVEITHEGRLVFAPPRSRAGDAMVLRAEMDLAIALSACPASTCNGGGSPKPLAFEIFGVPG